MDQVKFVALDPDDLEVVSTHLQDAVIRVADVHWRPHEKRLVVGLERFDWEAFNSASPQMIRRPAALRFERVLSCKCRQITQNGKAADGKAADGKAADGKGVVLNLLAVEFEPTNVPAGVVRLTFSGGPVLRLDVECLEVELVDLGAGTLAASGATEEGRAAVDPAPLR